MTDVRIARPDSLPDPGARFVVVEASAGTGKTYFLEHRVVDLIMAGAQLGQILLVTFTDKAVAELRLRIRDLLDRFARETSSNADGAASGWTLNDAARTRLRDAVAAFDHAPIFTIHGFCHRVLIEDAFAAQRLFDQVQVADELAFDAAFISLLRERFANISPDRELLGAFLDRGGTVDQLRRLLLQCTRSGALPRHGYDPVAAVALGDELRAVFGTDVLRAKLFASLPLGGHDKRHVPNWLAAIGETIEAWTGEPAGVFAACDAMRKVKTTTPAASLLARIERSPAHAAIAELLRRAIAMMSLDEAIASVMLPAVLDRIGADKAEQGMFDYDDMLGLVREALHGVRGSELAARLRVRTPWVMIDEFQDTDPVQWDIFRTVWLHDDAHGLTIVGDPKQAIYGFRGADVATYQIARDELVRIGAAGVALDVNQRATAPMVAAVNQILIEGSPLAPLLDKSITYDHVVRASHEIVCESPRPPVTVFALPGGNRDANRDALATVIGIEIEQLRDTPPIWTDRGRSVPFALGQIMVLTRTNKDSAAIAAALRSRGLPCALVEGDRLFDTREAHELASVLAAIAAPRDRSARLRALRTRFFDVPWADLMYVVDAPDHHPLIARLFDWAALASRRAYETLFRQVVEDSRFAERALVLGSGERAIINTWHLIELLLEQVARSRCDLNELVEQLRRWITDGADQLGDRDVQRAETDSDAIRILTIHKAKGLEAPYVFLFGAASPPRRSNVHTLRDVTGRSLVIGSHDEAIQRLLEVEQDAENQRLAYVALTRAKIRMYLPRYADKVTDDASAYHPIQRCLLPLVARRHPLFEIVEVAADREVETPAPVDALAAFDPPAPPPVGERAAIDGPRAGLAMLSYTRLGHELEAAAIEPGELPVAIDPAEFDVEPPATAELATDERLREGGGPSESAGVTQLPPGIDSGLVLHDLLEHAELDGVRRAPDAAAWAADPEVAAMLAEHGRSRGIAPQHYGHAARLVYGALTSPLAVVGGSPLPPLIAAAAFAREVEFAFPIPGPIAPGLVRGYIDALVAWDDALWVLDYKSDVLAGDPAAVAVDHVRDHYAIQQRLYALAADRLRGTRRLAGMLFAFIRYGVVVAVPFTDDKLAAWSHWLATLRTEATQP